MGYIVLLKSLNATATIVLSVASFVLRKTRNDIVLPGRDKQNMFTSYM